MDSPYHNPLKHITDVSKYFRHDPKTHTMIFIGDTLEVRVPARFEVYGMLNVADTVETIGVMDLIIDESFQASLHMPAMIELEPSEMSSIMVRGLQYKVLHFSHGDRFIVNTQVVKNQSIVYTLYVEFITRGNLMYTYGYQDLMTMFDLAKHLCDSKVPVDHAIFEVIYAHLSRSAKDLFTQYRHTDMKDAAFDFVALRSVSHAPDSTTARMLGSYFSEGVLASLLHENEDRKPFEDLLRGIPTSNVEESHSET